MTIKLRNLALLWTLLVSFSCRTLGLYEDQIGKSDWRHQYLGKVLFVEFGPSVSPPGRRVIVGTEQNVIASVTARTGDIGWRHLFESGMEGTINDMVLEGNSLVVVTGGGLLVRCFNPALGNLLWENSVEKNASNGRASLKFIDSETVAVLTKSTLTAYNAETGSVRWTHSLPNSDMVEYTQVYIEGGDVTVVGVVRHSHITLVTYNEDIHKAKTSVTAHWADPTIRCEVASSGRLVCLDPVMKALYVLVQGSSSGATDSTKSGQPKFVQTLLQDIGLPAHNLMELVPLQALTTEEGANLIAIKFGDRHMAAVSVDESGAKLVRDLPGASTLQRIRYAEQTVLLSLSRTDEESLRLRAFDGVTGSELNDMSLTLHFSSHHGLPQQLYSHIFKKRDGSKGALVLVLSEDHSVALLQQSGKVAWVREEALASVVSIEMVDLPMSQSQQEIEEEFAEQENGKYDIIAMALRRISSQFTQLKTAVSQLKSRLKVPRHGHASGSDVVDEENDVTEGEEYLTRDEFNLHKMILVVTEAGKLYGLDSYTGKPVWRYFLSDVEPFSRTNKKMMPLFVQRTTAHYPHLPQCTIIGKHKVTGQGVLFSFNPIAGTPSDDMPPSGLQLNYDVYQTTIFQHMDEHFMRPLVILDRDLQYHIYPESSIKVVEDLADSLFVFTTDTDKGTLRGYAMTHGPLHSLVAKDLWTVNLQRDMQVITNVVPKRALEQVHSQGIVLGDRSVLYKYLNPNLVVVTAEGVEHVQSPSQSQPNKNPFINVYLLDAVTGNIVFHCNHKKAKGPVHVVHSENWVVYNYWNQRHRRNEVAVLEMYEGQKQSNATVFSSLTPPPPPIVMRQAYVFPGYISSMAATLTEKGITNKHVLIALETGGILEMPKALLDPRRPVVLTMEHKEEGMIPYIPELPRPYEAIINYNQSVYNVRGLATAPAGLESTSLIVCYGLDMFGTRVMPSKMFDVLKEDFDYLFIALVLVGMILVSIITQKLATRKALNRAWK